MENLGPQVMSGLYFLKLKTLDIPLVFSRKLTIMSREGQNLKFFDRAKNTSEAPLAMAKKESEEFFQFQYIQ